MIYPRLIRRGIQLHPLAGMHLSDRFITHMLARNVRIEEDLVDQLFNSSEKRLARTLLLLARYGKPDQTDRVLLCSKAQTRAGDCCMLGYVGVAGWPPAVCRGGWKMNAT